MSRNGSPWFLAVRQLVRILNARFCCFVGPPEWADFAWPCPSSCDWPQFRPRVARGVRDEAEIRGHRRPISAALPGQGIQMMKKGLHGEPDLRAGRSGQEFH